MRLSRDTLAWASGVVVACGILGTTLYTVVHWYDKAERSHEFVETNSIELIDTIVQADVQEERLKVLEKIQIDTSKRETEKEKRRVQKQEFRQELCNNKEISVKQCADWGIRVEE